VKFEWDESKNQINIAKHGIDFSDAKGLFDSTRATSVDSRRDYGEVRKISVGKIEEEVCVVVYTQRGDVKRIISARKANRRERRRYNEFVKAAETEET
jgi:uncharacterized DUF497 family protein